MKKFYTFLILAFTVVVSNAQIVSIPDANFKAKLLSSTTSNQVAKNLAGVFFKIDANSDGEIQVSEALQVSYIDITCTSCASNVRTTSLSGYESFTNLKTLISRYNNLANYDVTISDPSSIEELKLYESLHSVSLTNVSNLKQLGFLDGATINGNVIIDNAPQLNNHSGSGSSLDDMLYFGCDINGKFKINNCNALSRIQFSNGTGGLAIDSVSVSNMNNLQILSIKGELSGSNASYPNSIKKIKLSNLNSLNMLTVEETGITDLELYNFIENLTYFNLTKNKALRFLNVMNTHISTFLLYGNNNLLERICVDDNTVQVVTTTVAGSAISSTCKVTPYCSFLPFGNFYTIHGTTRFDFNNDCDPFDTAITFQKFSISSGSTNRTLISNSSANYTTAVQAGDYSIIPILENPTYFNVSPPSLQLTFPGAASPYVQNFCISPNGEHIDLEVTLIPLNPARGGFNSRYKVIYKNKGSVITSGVVNFSFQNDFMYFVTSVPNYSNQSTGLLNYDFANLAPFETREIVLEFHLNSSVQTPPIHAGDQLNFVAVINPIDSDEFPFDNTSSLKQIVVSSYDPNDKTCIEGAIVSPSTVGQYVHYVVRFENTGTANAENIVVKDIIDTAKYDISSLVPLSGSASYVTRITNTNQVEFIFENINLPFDDATNDGYVAFKIKTKPTLVVGDTFSNTANIYFDYNFPIITNTATTTIATLGTQDFEFDNVYSLSPVPTKNMLTITTKQNAIMSSVSIYNTLGQLMQVSTNPTETIDVSGLKTGSYFIKIVSDKGTSSAKFIKE